MERFFTVLAWTGRTLFNVFQVLVVLYVFSRLQGRLEVIVVSVLGLLYLTVRTIAFSQATTLANFGSALQKEINDLVHLLGHDIKEREANFVEMRKMVSRNIAMGYLDEAFLALISLICLFNLFTTL